MNLIINEADLLPVDALLVVLLLLHLEDVRHKELLKVLVGVVDAELLEAVRVKVLEAKDVEDPNRALGSLCFRFEDGNVHPVIKQTTLQGHVQFISACLLTMKIKSLP